MTTSSNLSRLSARTPVALFCVGIATIAVYYALSALGIGKVGAPTDIGGGLMLLFGYLAGSIGLIWLVIRIARRRPGHHTNREDT